MHKVQANGFFLENSHNSVFPDDDDEQRKKRNKPCKVEVTVDVKRKETKLLFSIIHYESLIHEELVGGALNGRDREWWLGEEERGGGEVDVKKRVVAR